MGASLSESQHLLDLPFGTKERRSSLATPVADVNVPRTEIPKKLLKRYLTAVSLIEKEHPHRSQYIHVSIKRTTVSKESKREIQSAAHLLDLDQTFSVIVSPAGGGKTTLWRYLVSLCARKNYIEKYLPVPIDISSIGFSQGGESLLCIAFPNLFDQLDSRQSLYLEQYLETALRDGRAVALIDEFESLHKLSQDNRERIRRWKRVIGFCRSRSGIGETARGTIYELIPLNEQQQREFIRTWGSDAHRFDSNELLPKMQMSPQRAQIYNIPIFIDLLCEISTQEDTWPESAWALLDRTFTLQLDRVVFPHTLSKAKFRVALTDLALHGYRLSSDGRQIVLNFSEAEILTAWRQFNAPQTLLKKAIQHGFLQKMPFDERYTFAHAIQQAFLAAETWVRYLLHLNKQEFLKEIHHVAYQPAYSDVCVFAVAQLDSQRDTDGVISFLENIASADQCVLDDHKWMLIGKCVVETSKETQDHLEKIAVVVEARKHLLNLFIYAPDGMDEAVSQILCRWRTQESGETILGIIGHGEFDSTIICRLARLLGEMQFNPAVPLLTSLALNPKNDWSVRVAACAALGLIRNMESAEALQSLLHLRDIYSQVVEALVTHNTPQSARILIAERKVLDQFSMGSRAIEDFTNPLVLPVFREALDHSFDISIAIAVQHIGGEEAVQILASLLRNENVGQLYSERVSELLGGMKLPSACGALVEYARDVQAPFRHRYFALGAIPKGCDVPSLDLLIDMAFVLGDSDLFPESSDDFPVYGPDIFRFQATSNLIWASNADLIARLGNILKRGTVDAKLRFAETWLAPSLKRRDLLLLLRMLAEDPESDVRDQGTRCLAHLGEEHAIVKVLEDFASAPQNNEDVDRFSELMGALKEQRALPLLKKTLYQKSSANMRVIYALGEIATYDAADILIQWVQDRSLEHYQLKSVVEALSHCSHSAIVEMIVRSSMHSQRAGTGLLGCLTHIHDVSLIESLLAFVAHPNEDVRRYIAITLGNFSDERVIVPLLQLAADPDEFVREEAEKALKFFQGRIHDNRTITLLVKSLQSKILLERRAAYIALKYVSAEHKTKSLVNQLKKRLTLEKNPDLEYLAFKSFAKFGGAEVVPYFRDLLSSAEGLETRKSLFKVLASTNDSRVVPFLIRAIQEDRFPPLAHGILPGMRIVDPLPAANAPPSGFETLSLVNSKWIELVNPYFLDELIKHANIPQVQSVLRRISERYNLCIMKDSTVFLSTGERVAGKDVAGRLV